MFISRLPRSSTRHVRQYHNQRSPNYAGWWSSMLNQPIRTPEDPKNSTELIPTNIEQRVKIAVPFGEEPETFPEVSEMELEPVSFVEVNGERIAIPERPKTPDNCCMSGCVHCVWDIYQEDMEYYREKKKALRKKMIAANEIIPPELQPKFNAGGDATDDLDPGMKAFLEMEKKLQGR
ncbi:hypothetical protein INT43_005232 [Umbelopsis isabellina]|uniref:Oxidoreductase-like domain-containing protein n=1 Tax=Mortierella isabellina TaxID=91625 RepID=A0A8H7U9X5_MORIS|nr:hypothetical protein INT43_005232 [Umbelopsis isabellina]